MPIVAILTATEAELYSAVQCTQDIMFIYRLFLSLGLETQLPMILEIDNKGVVNFCNEWSVAGRLRYI